MPLWLWAAYLEVGDEIGEAERNARSGSGGCGSCNSNLSDQISN